MVSDGAAMMLKMGHEILAEHQVCLAHGMHLAVIEVLYKTKAYIQAPGPDETNDNSFQELTCEDDLIPAEEEDFNVQEELKLELVSDLAGIIKKQRWSRGHKARGQGQGQPFRGQNLSRPRTGMLEAKTKDTGASVLLKKRPSKIFFRRSPIHWHTQNF